MHRQWTGCIVRQVIQNLPTGVFLVMLAFAAAFVAIPLFAAFRARQQMRALSDVRATSIAQAGDGYIRIEGHARQLEGVPVNATLTGANVVWFHSRVRFPRPVRQARGRNVAHHRGRRKRRRIRRARSVRFHSDLSRRRTRDAGRPQHLVWRGAGTRRRRVDLGREHAQHRVRRRPLQRGPLDDEAPAAGVADAREWHLRVAQHVQPVAHAGEDVGDGPGTAGLVLVRGIDDRAPLLDEMPEPREVIGRKDLLRPAQPVHEHDDALGRARPGRSTQARSAPLPTGGASAPASSRHRRRSPRGPGR